MLLAELYCRACVPWVRSVFFCLFVFFVVVFLLFFVVVFLFFFGELGKHPVPNPVNREG